MDLRSKALYGLICIIIITSVILAVLSTTVILGHFQSLESTYIQSDMRLVNRSIDGELKSLSAEVPDWGAWDDTYQYVTGKKPDFPAENIVNTTFDTLRIDFIVITGRDGQVLYAQGYDPDSDTIIPVRADIIAALKEDRAHDMVTGADGGEGGFLNLPGGPVMIASYPVIHSNYSGPVIGAVIMGRYVDDREIRILTGSMDVDLSFESADSAAIPPQDRALLEAPANASILVRPVSDSRVEGRKLIRDIYNQPALFVTLQTDRDIYQQGRDTVAFFIILELGVLVIAGILALLFLDKNFLVRISTLSNGLAGIAKNGTLSTRFPEEGDDEIAHLAMATNHMLGRIAHEQASLKESEERYSSIVNNAPGPILITDNWEILFVNDAGVNASGYTRQELVGKNLRDFLTPDSLKAIPSAQKPRAAGPAGEIAEFEISFIRKDKKISNLIVRTVEITYHGKKATIAHIADITRRRQMEDALLMANKKISMLSSITRHDIKNQLVALRGFLGLSELKATDPELAGFLQKADQAAEAINRQIEFTKTYEEIGASASEWQDIGGLVSSARTQLPIPETVRVRADMPPVEIFADQLIEKVFYNLMENSLRHGEHVSEIRFSFTESAGEGRIVYEDNGVGITREDKSRLFQRGFGRNTGLGLFLSREILGITGMTIQETGEPGRGVRFWILVPKGGYRFTGDERS
jgi:PAS domain S-box-containing protein